MSLTALTTTPNDNADDAYQAGYLDGLLDAASKLPAALAMARASMADPHNPAWAQGYTDGFQHGIEAANALHTSRNTVPEP